MIEADIKQQKGRPKAQKSSSKTAAGGDTHKRILESASMLFAKNGLNGVSIREIVLEADVNVALANYHFGSKERLYVSAATRYVNEINQARSEQLALVNRSRTSAKRQLRAILAGYVTPHFSVATKPGGMEYLQIFSRFLMETPEISKTFIDEQFGDIRLQYLTALCEVLEPISKDHLYRGFSFFVTNMLIAPRDIGYELLSDEELTPEDLVRTGELLVEFAAAGLWALRS